VRNALESFARQATRWAGSSVAFVLAVLLVGGWLLYALVFNLWQDTATNFFINTSTTIITFLMVFIIQRAQNQDTRAVHVKLDEIIAALEGASNRLVGAEELSEAEVERLARRYRELAEAARRRRHDTGRHSVEEVDEP
jgi:low affinity Fe/Cu permease